MLADDDARYRFEDVTDLERLAWTTPVCTTGPAQSDNARGAARRSAHPRARDVVDAPWVHTHCRASALVAEDASSAVSQMGPLAGSRLAAPRPLVVSDDRSAGAADRLSLEAIILALRLVALALGAFRPFSQVFDLTSGPIVQGWVA